MTREQPIPDFLGAKSDHTAKFPGAPDQVGPARRFVYEALGDHPCSDDAQLLTSEAATNAVRHTRSGNGGSFWINLWTGDTSVIVAVRDLGSPNIPCVRPQSDTATNGRGVQLFDAIARRWGYCRDEQGTTVWFELAHTVAG